jgi:hypothetical protein
MPARTTKPKPTPVVARHANRPQFKLSLGTALSRGTESFFKYCQAMSIKPDSVLSFRPRGVAVNEAKVVHSKFLWVVGSHALTQGTETGQNAFSGDTSRFQRADGR